MPKNRLDTCLQIVKRVLMGMSQTTACNQEDDNDIQAI